MQSKRPVHVYEVRPRKDRRGVDLISDALPVGRLELGRSYGHAIPQMDADADKMKWLPIETLAEFNCEFGHGRRAVHRIANSAEQFFEMSLWYSRKRLADAVIKIYKVGLTACAPTETRPFHEGRTVMRQSLRKLQALLDEHEPSWEAQRRRILSLLSFHGNTARFHKGRR
jgi:hypothetical protein